MDEELTISQIAREFKVARYTVNRWVWSGKLPARKEFGELGIEYWVVKRSEVEKVLTNLSQDGRRLKRAY